jgi:uncharacterized membrane protein YcaP (DUF421 family)
VSHILRTAAIYLVILIGLRLAGKREMGQMTVFDLVVLLLIANAVQNAMVGPDTSLTGGVLDVANVEMAVLEIDGSISVVPAGGTTMHVKRPVKYLKRQ